MPLKYISEIAARNFPSNAGIYVISPDAPSKQGPKNVKIGRSINIRKRLNDYHICWPEGFHIWMVIKLSPKTRALTKKDKIEITKVLEKKVFDELIHLNLVGPARRFHEYFVIGDDDFEALKEAIERVAIDHRPITDFPPITTWKKGTAYQDFEIDGEKVKV
jgi:hypothetical protein